MTSLANNDFVSEKRNIKF